ncbi:signal peptide [Streptococcus criceti]|uniref:Uncharacterized protein n=1 Tax=Streptococcus criceti HS-6 TaxID=873449 RepID=G5JRX2_STRCG|nr:hypothetical protein [Streptococcus criceti]EHI75275.1 hypothetical protein STRCR_0830 [Streptococcus criceti HS-6]SUN43643.1 signal peptide [Streptococcus criceti]
MDDWEIRNSIDRNTWEQSRQSSALEKIQRNQERFHQELIDEQQEREMREKISRLELALAQTSDPKKRQQVKNLLDEAILEQNLYYIEKDKLERQERRKQLIYNILVVLILVVLACVAFVLWTSYQNKKSQTDQIQASSISLSSSQASSDLTSSSTQADSERVAYDGVFPNQMIGTWKGTMSGMPTTITFSSNGDLRIKVNGSDSSSSEVSGTVYSMIPVDETTYRIVDYSGTVLPAQLGGSGIQYDFGYKLSSDGQTLYPILWQYGMNEEPNYSEYSIYENGSYTKVNN